MSYRKNKIAAIYNDSTPTMTDQSAARETDINVIVPRFLAAGGTGMGTSSQPMYIDTTNLPTDLRGFIEASNTMEEYRAKLPPELRHMATEELLALTPEEIKTKLTPPVPKTGPEAIPANVPNDKKETK